jgi:preprotein translocase subunit SecD
VSEPQVARQGVDRIAIQLPGLQNSAEVKKILGKTATLEFRMVDETDNPLEAAATGHVPLGAKLYYTREKQPGAAQARSGGHRRPADRRLVPAEHPGRSRGVGESRQPRRREDAEEYAGESRSPDGGRVHRPFAREERRRASRSTARPRRSSTARRFAACSATTFQITGVNPIEGRELALLLRAGGLAAPLDAVEERAIGPSLGQDNIDKGVQRDGVRHAGRVRVHGGLLQGVRLIADVVLAANVVLLTALLSWSAWR